MTRKRPPSYYRYRETHRTIQIILTDNLKAIIDEKKGTRSYGEYIKSIIYNANPSENEKQEHYDQGKIDGYSIGHGEGLEQGKEEGYEKGKIEGYDEGFQIGFKQGYEKGSDDTMVELRKMEKKGMFSISFPK